MVPTGRRLLRPRLLIALTAAVVPALLGVGLARTALAQGSLTAPDGQLSAPMSAPCSGASCSADHLSFILAPAHVGTQSLGTLEVAVKDAGGATVTTDPRLIMLSINQNAAGFSCAGNTLTATTSNGVATFPACTETTDASYYIITATDVTSGATSLAPTHTAMFAVQSLATITFHKVIQGGGPSQPGDFPIGYGPATGQVDQIAYDGQTVTVAAGEYQVQEGQYLPPEGVYNIVSLACTVTAGPDAGWTSTPGTWVPDMKLAASDQASCTATNAYTPPPASTYCIGVQKNDAYGTGSGLLAGAVFELIGSDGTTVLQTSQPTDSSGTAWFCGVQDGDSVVETVHPLGYDLTPQLVTLPNDCWPTTGANASILPAPPAGVSDPKYGCTFVDIPVAPPAPVQSCTSSDPTTNVVWNYDVPQDWYVMIQPEPSGTPIKYMQVWPNPIASMEIGLDVGTYTFQWYDANGVEITGETASGTLTIGNCPPSVPPPPAVVTPQIALAVSASPTSLTGSGSVTYTYTVTNPGSLTLSGVTVTDSVCTPTYVSGDTNEDTLLEPGESWTYSCTATLSATTTDAAKALGANNGTTVSASAATTVTVTASALTPVALTDGIAAGVDRGTSGFGITSLVVLPNHYVTVLGRTSPNLAGSVVEIWVRSKAGDWHRLTSRLVAADGTVHYFARVNGWTAYWLKFAGDTTHAPATSHGRITTSRG